MTITLKEALKNRGYWNPMKTENGDFILYHASHVRIEKLLKNHPLPKGIDFADRLQFVTNPLYHDLHLENCEFYGKKDRENPDDPYFYSYSIVVPKNIKVFTKKKGLNPFVNFIINENGVSEERFGPVISVIDPSQLNNVAETKIKLITRLKFGYSARDNYTGEFIDPYLKNLTHTVNEGIARWH